MRNLRIHGGQALLPDHGLTVADISLDDGQIAGIGAGGGGPALDARGLLVLPGIVDIHGDAFERQLQPRPGIDFPVGLALADTEPPPITASRCRGNRGCAASPPGGRCRMASPPELSSATCACICAGRPIISPRWTGR